MSLEKAYASLPLNDAAALLYFKEPKAFQDFVDYVDNVIQGGLPPDPTKYFFAEFGRQFFTYPQVSSAGTNDGLVWGNIQPPPLTDATTKTIFSLWDDSGNEAIVKKALSILLERVDGGFANTQKQEAIALLQLIWKKITDENQKAQRLQHARFATVDMFGHGNGTSQIGNFSGIDVIS